MKMKYMKFKTNAVWNDGTSNEPKRTRGETVNEKRIKKVKREKREPLQCDGITDETLFNPQFNNTIAVDLVTILLLCRHRHCHLPSTSSSQHIAIHTSKTKGIIAYLSIFNFILEYSRKCSDDARRVFYV